MNNLEYTTATVIVGRQSNLSQHLRVLMPGALLLSARELRRCSSAQLPKEPFNLIINGFQPATRLQDFTDPVEYVDLAIGNTARLLSVIERGNCAKVIYTSSASVYGNSLDCRETDRPSASDLHSSLKVANEALVRRACEAQGIDYTVARVFNMYGGNDEFSIIAKIVAAVRCSSVLELANNGNAIRDFVHLGDVARVYVRLLAMRGMPVLNVATGVGVSIRNIIDLVRLNGYELATRSYHQQEIKVSTAYVGALAAVIDISSFVQVTDHVLQRLREVRACRPAVNP